MGNAFLYPCLKSLQQWRAELKSRRSELYGSLMLQMMQNLACNGLDGVEERCCRWLLITRDRLNDDDVPLSNEFLGQMLGVRRASVSDVLKPLKEMGLLDYTRRNIKLLGREAIQARACECLHVISDAFAWLKTGE